MTLSSPRLKVWPNAYSNEGAKIKAITNGVTSNSNFFNTYPNIPKNNKKYKSDYKTDFILNYLNANSFNENSFYIQSTIDQTLQKISEKSLLDNLALFERKYKK